jgi:hypothetical protein
VRWEFLQAIEQEQFSYVPRADLRVALRSYSAWLDIDLRPYYVRPQPRHASLKANLALVAALTLLALLALALLIA